MSSETGLKNEIPARTSFMVNKCTTDKSTLYQITRRYNPENSHFHPLAVYVHCGTRSLNLAISEVCSVPSIRNCAWQMLSIDFLRFFPLCSFQQVQVSDHFQQHVALKRM
jgi:hypothetical protein